MTPQDVCAQAIKALLAEEFPAMRRIETASLHRGIAGSQHSFLPVPPGSNKMQQLLQVRRCTTFEQRHCTA